MRLVTCFDLATNEKPRAKSTGIMFFFNAHFDPLSICSVLSSRDIALNKNNEAPSFRK